jgi:hypothetical protein
MPSYLPYIIAAAGMPAALFGYLRYRAYVGLVKHVVDKEGVAGLRAMGHVTGPWRTLAKAIAARRQLPGVETDVPPTQLRQAG